MTRSSFLRYGRKINKWVATPIPNTVSLLVFLIVDAMLTDKSAEKLYVFQKESLLSQANRFIAFSHEDWWSDIILVESIGKDQWVIQRGFDSRSCYNPKTGYFDYDWKKEECAFSDLVVAMVKGKMIGEKIYRMRTGLEPVTPFCFL